jgi:hypothetical protein
VAILRAAQQPIASQPTWGAPPPPKWVFPATAVFVANECCAGAVAEPLDVAAIQAEARAAVASARPALRCAAAAGAEPPMHASTSTAGDGAHPAAAAPAAVRNAAPEDVEVVFLGTGAAIPAKYRNVTGIYVSRYARGGMLLDCGAGPGTCHAP